MLKKLNNEQDFIAKELKEKERIRDKQFLIKRMKELNNISFSNFANNYNLSLHSDTRVIGRNICLVAEGIAYQEKQTEEKIWNSDK